MTKKQLVDAILKIKKVDTRSNLMQKKNSDLEYILSELKEPQEAIQETANEHVADEVENIEVKKVEPPKKKVIDRDMMVSCRNLTSGRLTYISKKTGLETVWSQFGDEEYIDIGELLTMKSSQPKFLKEPWVFIEDEDVVEYLGLKELYETIIPIDEVDDFFNLTVNEARNILPKLPRGMKTLIAEKARQGIQDGTLINIQLVRLLETELQLDLISLME